MADVVEQGERRGLSRRDMIKASAAAGAAAWTAPVIIDSLTSPAAATSGLATGISHIDVVFTSTGGGTCGLADGNYELFWNLSGWASPGAGNRCADATHLFNCSGGTSDGPSCLITTLNGISGLVTTDSCGCIHLNTTKLPTGVTACINHSRTFCGNTTFPTNGLDSKCAMPCSNSSATDIVFCCVVETGCCTGGSTSGCTC